MRLWRTLNVLRTVSRCFPKVVWFYIFWTDFPQSCVSRMPSLHYYLKRLKLTLITLKTKSKHFETMKSKLKGKKLLWKNLKLNKKPKWNESIALCLHPKRLAFGLWSQQTLKSYLTQSQQWLWIHPVDTLCGRWCLDTSGKEILKMKALNWFGSESSPPASCFSEWPDEVYVWSLTRSHSVSAGCLETSLGTLQSCFVLCCFELSVWSILNDCFFMFSRDCEIGGSAAAAVLHISDADG